MGGVHRVAVFLGRARCFPGTLEEFARTRLFPGRIVGPPPLEQVTNPRQRPRSPQQRRCLIQNRLRFLEAPLQPDRPRQLREGLRPRARLGQRG